MHIFKLFLMSDMKQNMGAVMLDELDLYSSMQSMLSILQQSRRKHGSILTTAFPLGVLCERVVIYKNNHFSDYWDILQHQKQISG